MATAFNFDSNELLHIFISVCAISFAFSLAFAGPSGLLASPPEFFVLVVLSFVTVGSGFILHEMGHKLSAMYYGARARFIMWTQGLIFMIITSFFGVLFAAPGAVYIYSNNISKRQNGIISICGPVVNLGLVIFFLVLSVIAPINIFLSILSNMPLSGFGINAGMVSVWQFGAALNIMLALFNTIPAFPLDGSKVYDWNKLIWGLIVLVFLGLAIILISPLIVVSWLFLFTLALIFSWVLFRRSKPKFSGAGGSNL